MTGRAVALVLAAGGSRRLGRSKQFLRRRGATLLHASVRNASQATGQAPWVVTGARGLAVALAARRAGAYTVHNPGWRGGMGSSLARGLRRLRNAAAVLVVTVDQYRVGRADLGRLLHRWRSHPSRAAAARYGGRAGIPAVLPRRHLPALRRLHGDRGARTLLNANPRPVLAVDMPHAARDIDTPAHWRALAPTWGEVP